MTGLGRACLRFSDILASLGAGVAAIFLSSIPILVVAEILARALFGRTVGISWEYSTYFMALVFLFGAAYTLRTGGHIRISVLPLRTRPLAASAVELIASVIGAAISIFLAAALTDLSWQAYSREITSATPEQTPLVYPMTGAAIGAWLLSLQMFARIIAVFTGAQVEHDPPDADADEVPDAAP